MNRGKFVQTYTPEKTASYENLIKMAAAEAMNGRPIIQGPCDVEIGCDMPVPASWSDKKRKAALAGTIRPCVKPDTDNVLKIVCDGINKIVYDDDKQVVSATFYKFYAETPGLTVTITEI